MALPAPQESLRTGWTRTERSQILAMGLAVAALLAMGALLLVLGTRGHPASLSLGTGLLALTLGMRHAFDADHLAAIDNTTRTLMARGERPLSAGFWFSLGHSSVVFVLTLLLAFGLRGLGASVADPASGLHLITGVVGTCVSAGFLLAIAAFNVALLRGIVRSIRSLRTGTLDHSAVDTSVLPGGPLTRLFAPLIRRVDSPLKMYPLGLAFGLGFDTATEVGLLVLSGTAVASGLSIWAVLSLPLLFAGGMSLLDTLDGYVMNLAYGWALVAPGRRLYYNFVITSLSVAVAVLIGSLEISSLVIERLNLRGGIFDLIGSLDLTVMGFFIAGLFLLTWLLALLLWRFGGLAERFEQR